MLVALQMASRTLVSDFHDNVECTIVRPSATGLWVLQVASVREARPLMNDEGNAGMNCTR